MDSQLSSTTTSMPMREVPVLYRKGNNITRVAAIECLEEYASKLKWKHNGERIFDVGVADGSVTDILIRYVPKNYETLIGYDISEEMVNFANDHHGDERTKFKVLDIVSDLPAELKGAFDHGFSFCTFHWISDQEKGFTNLFDLLTQDGECLVTFFGHFTLYSLFRALSQTKKWDRYLGECQKFVSDYHDGHVCGYKADPTPKIKDMLKKIGFKYIDVQCKQRVYVYESTDAMLATVTAVNPFKIPMEMEQDFMSDFVQVARDMRIVDEANKVTFNHNLFVVHCRK